MQMYEKIHLGTPFTTVFNFKFYSYELQKKGHLGGRGTVMP